MTWANIENKPFGPYDLENIPSGFILDAEFLNTFAEAIDERFNVMYPLQTYGKSFVSKEIMTGSVANPFSFFRKVRDLVAAYANLYNSFDWVDPSLIDDPHLDPRLPANDGLNIKTADIQTLLTVPVYNVIFNVAGARNEWNNLKLASTWSGMYKLYKFLKVYYEDNIGQTNNIIERRPCIQIELGLRSIDPARDGNSVQAQNEFRGVYVGSFGGWPAGVDYPTTEQRYIDSVDVYELEVNMTAGNIGNISFFDNVGFEQKSWDNVTPNQLNLHRGKAGYSLGYLPPMDLQCKRISDALVLSMKHSTAVEIPINTIQEEYVNNQGGSVTQPEANFDLNFNHVPFGTPGPYEQFSIVPVISQETEIYGTLTRNKYRYALQPPNPRPVMRPVVNDIQDPPPVATGFVDSVQKRHFFQYRYKDITFIEVNNVDLNYYIVP